MNKTKVATMLVVDVGWLWSPALMLLRMPLSCRQCQCRRPWCCLFRNSSLLLFFGVVGLQSMLGLRVGVVKWWVTTLTQGWQLLMLNCLVVLFGSVSDHVAKRFVVEVTRSVNRCNLEHLVELCCAESVSLSCQDFTH